MIKSINQLVTQECNSHCKMCLIWTFGKDPNQMSPEEFGRLYSRKEFSSVEDLCISGGEPTLREDLPEIMDYVIPNIPQLKMLFLSTNCSFPERVVDFMIRNSGRVAEIYSCVSLEGDKETHKKIRGVDTHDLVVETLERVRGLKLPNAKSIISTTVQLENANIESMEYIKQLASKTRSTYSFRPAMISETFYGNNNTKNLHLTPDQIKFFVDYIKREKINDPFMTIQKDFLEGKRILVGDKKSGIKCLAGDISVFIKSNGDIYPCINSKKIIGDKKRGLYFQDFKLGDMEYCPCCTECQIYPMLNFSQYSDKRSEQR
ncbi:MAG: radical SAM protein [archaeon]|nr:radical SAM protein [archaeon]